MFGENLIQKSAPLDAVLMEDELEELHSYCQEVFGRVSRFHQRLVSRPVSAAARRHYCSIVKDSMSQINETKQIND